MASRLVEIVLDYCKPSITIAGLSRPMLIDGLTVKQLAYVAAGDEPPEEWLEGGDEFIAVGHGETKTTWVVRRTFGTPQSPPQAEPAPPPAPPASVPRLMSGDDIAKLALSAYERGCSIDLAGLRLLAAGVYPEATSNNIRTLGILASNCLPPEVFSASFSDTDHYQRMASACSFKFGRDYHPIHAVFRVTRAVGEVAGLFERRNYGDTPMVPREELLTALGELLCCIAGLAGVFNIPLSEAIKESHRKHDQEAAGTLQGTGDR